MEEIIDSIRQLQANYDRSCEINKAFMEDRVVVIKYEGYDGYELKELDPLKAIQEISKARLMKYKRKEDEIIMAKFIPLIDAELLKFYEEHQ